MQQSADKTFFDLRAGLVTEAGPLNTPDGATVDEQNFHLFVDGSRRRRRGLRIEENGVTIPSEGYKPEEASRVGKWLNAGGNPDNDFIVLQKGRTLRFFRDETTTISPKFLGFTLDLEPYSTNEGVDWWKHPVSFASGNGILTVTGRYIHPFTIEWQSGAPVPRRITALMRDFKGFDSDTLNVVAQPTELSAEHRYNLRNRGWRQEDIDAYFAEHAKYPSLSMLWHKGYARLVDDTVYTSEDGTKQFNAEKIAAEPFGNQSAPQGSLLVDPFDTTTGATAFLEPVEITSWDYEPFGTDGRNWLITAQTSEPHGISVLNKFYIQGHKATYMMELREDTTIDGSVDPFFWYLETVLSFDGKRTAWVGTSNDTITFLVPSPDNFHEWANQFAAMGSLDKGLVLENPDGYVTNERPTASAWYAGRLWMAGVSHPELADKLLYSQIGVSRKKFGNFFQFNDPTNDELNQLLATDGGVIQLSDVGQVQGLLPYQSVLLVFADNGVWEVTGARGVFSPDSYGIRKVTDSRCSSPWGYVEAEGRVLFLGHEGIFSIQPDEHTGILYAVSVTEASIQSEWSRVPSSRQRHAKMMYDPVNKQAWVLFDNVVPATPEPGEPLVYQHVAEVYHRSFQGFSVTPDVADNGDGGGNGGGGGDDGGGSGDDPPPQQEN